MQHLLLGRKKRHIVGGTFKPMGLVLQAFYSPLSMVTTNSSDLVQEYLPLVLSVRRADSKWIAFWLSVPQL